MKKTSTALQYAVCVGVALILTFLIIINIIFAYETIASRYFFVTFLFLFALMCVFRYVKIPEKQFLCAFICVAVICKVAVALLVDAYPVSDFLVMFNAAKQAAVGDFSFQNKSYFSLWSYQTGFVLYQAFFVKLFGEGTKALLVINGLLMASTNTLIYFIIKSITRETSGAMFGALLYLCYPAPYLLASVLTNQHLATCLILLGLYVIVRKQPDYRAAVIGGILISIGNIIRPIGIVAVASIAIYFLILLIQKVDFRRLREDWRQYTSIVGRGICIVGVYMLVGIILSSIIIATGINARGLKNNDPYWKFVVGLNYDTYGAYSEALAESISKTNTLAERTQIERNLIADALTRIANKPFIFFYEKIYKMWAGNENIALSFGESASVNRSEEANMWWRNIIEKIIKLDKCYYLLLLVLALIGVSTAIIRKNMNLRLCLCALVFCLFFGAYIFVEIQTRYRYFSMPFICVLASYAIFLLPKGRQTNSKKSLDTHLTQ